MTGRFLLIALALALSAAACGDDDPLDAYYDDVAGVTTAYAAEVSELPIAATDSSLEDVRAFFSGVSDSLGRALADLEAISPPESMAQQHREFIVSMAEFAGLAERAAEGAAAMETQNDLIDMANDPEIGVTNFGALRSETIAACLLLQRTAETGGIDVDLKCRSFDPR